MWSKLALLIIKNRRLLVGLLAIITAFMAWKAKDVEMTYDFAQVVSPDDPDMVYFQLLFADANNIRTPTFVGYIFKYTVPYMLPMLLVIWWIWFR